MKPRARILVIRGGAIGDFILSLPVLSALRKQFPETGLELLGYKKTGELAQAAGVVDAVRSIEAPPLARFFARKGELDPAWQEYFGGFALIISYLYDPDLIFETNILLEFKGQWIAGPHRPNDADPLHATEVFLKPLERLAIFSPDRLPRLNLPAPPRNAAGGRWLAVHPGSGSEQKNWPEPHWIELLRRLAAETSLNLLLVGGEAEGHRLARIREHLPIERLEVAEHWPLPSLGGRLGQCDFFLGHDSGISHLAAAIGLPGLLLWGPSQEQVWRPLHPSMQLLKSSRGLAGITVEEVLQRVLALQPGSS